MDDNYPKRRDGCSHTAMSALYMEGIGTHEFKTRSQIRKRKTQIYVLERPDLVRLGIL